MKRRHALTILAALTLAVLLLGHAWAQTYTVTDLGTLPGTTLSQGSGINNLGQVCGYSQGATLRHAFLYTTGLPLQDIPAFSPTGQSDAGGVNSLGYVVGSAQTTKSQMWRAYLWRDGQLIDLLRKDASGATAVNDNGQIVGHVVKGAAATYAFLWQNGTWNYLPCLSTGGTIAYAINNSGLIAGSSRDVDGNTRAVTWSGGKIARLPLPAGFVASDARSMNSLGDVLGTATAADGTGYACIWPYGAATPTFITPNSTYNGISTAGVVGGIMVSGNPHAALWVNGLPYDLNDHLDPLTGLGWVLDTAFAINDNGQIAGRGHIYGATHAFLLTPQ